MKKILQAMDGATKPAVKADNEMKRFVSIIAEGKGPSNRPTQAEKIVTKHYIKKEQPVVEQKKITTGIDKYFKTVEQELLESANQAELKKKEKAQKLAERAIKEVGGNYGHHSNIKRHVAQSQRPPDHIVQMAKSGARVNNNRRFSLEDTDGTDSVSLDIPLLIRLFEFAREDAKDDMALHQVAEKLIALSKNGQTLSMDQYDAIVGIQKELPRK